ncbi:hypothetical protein MOB65_19265 [Bacillus inaquosorum]|uniref:hypothetical protein n=1 Tax=Bacillus inaquosorum TaxID=483913 RepID=UPI0022819BE2|nr:hypothetical protein [Bacillus inaquosorum]MCY7911004.1 hypothetical protein [Bacillus inaquosorum]
MEVIATLSEEEILSIIKDYFKRQGYDVCKWYVHTDSKDKLKADIFMKGTMEGLV